MAEVASVLETPWGMSTGPDLAFPSTRGSRPENFEKVQQFQAALFRAAVVDPVVHRALTEVAPLLQSQSLLREPDIMLASGECRGWDGQAAAGWGSDCFQCQGNSSCSLAAG